MYFRPCPVCDVSKMSDTDTLQKEFCMLPEKFADRMKEMLGTEYEPFESCYEQEKYRALRLNPLKGRPEDFLNRSLFPLSPVLWSPYGYYYEGKDTPGKHPYHEAGVYYIQEPSAQLPAVLLGAQPGERILDLCSAPGGKATQIAADMEGKGLLVCNEYVPSRAKILSENVERMGITNALVVNETPQKLADVFPDHFHRIMVDAPCSGEGMFRKNEEASTEWSPENVRMCADRQDEILEEAARMLLPGGRMVYSTCTFAPLENECTIARFLQNHPDFHVKEVRISQDNSSMSFEGMRSGNPDWAEKEMGPLSDEIREQIKRTIRLFPHMIKGEGHFAAVLEKEGTLLPAFSGVTSKNGPLKTIRIKDCKEYESFLKEEIRSDRLSLEKDGSCLRFGDQLYLVPEQMPGLKGLKVLRPGLHLGTVCKNRFEPSHALALALRPQEVTHTWNLEGNSREASDYLKGGTFRAEGEKGWYLITVDGYSIGWGKLAGGIMKNHYPKGLRKS